MLRLVSSRALSVRGGTGINLPSFALSVAAALAAVSRVGGGRLVSFFGTWSGSGADFKHIQRMRMRNANSTEAIKMLKEMERDGITPNDYHHMYNSAIVKCVNDGKFEDAKQVFRQMQAKKVHLDEITFYFD